ncbi:hypothetical protein Glove_71g125 [Diversispora epigaea]|uniref:Uncharacterized protein n=1 Tax=Diversispora epigaea TaxID=1348612 RepID=A0A397JKN9_9GLOM|nr:hypothetical protein Glove_71g125 [Diversispora epigaea]
MDIYDWFIKINNGKGSGKQMLERDPSLYEITKDLETLEYMMDLKYFKRRNITQRRLPIWIE